jgi:hypothetical protein
MANVFGADLAMSGDRLKLFVPIRVTYTPQASSYYYGLGGGTWQIRAGLGLGAPLTRVVF